MIEMVIYGIGIFSVGVFFGLVLAALLISNDRYENHKDTCEELYDTGYKDGYKDGKQSRD